MGRKAKLRKERQQNLPKQPASQSIDYYLPSTFRGITIDEMILFITTATRPYVVMVASDVLDHIVNLFSQIPPCFTASVKFDIRFVDYSSDRYFIVEKNTL